MSKTNTGDRVFGRYEVISLIQEGGQALVWKGRDLETGRSVAIKELLGESVELRRRFERENSVRLERKEIVQPQQVGEWEGRYFLVMEFIEGKNLSEIMKDAGAFAEARAIRIVQQVAQGLAAAHRDNIIHRDIKPENIMLTPADEVKITDFGIACFLDKERMTRIGSTLGTAHYMSPEQIEDASKVDATSDMFSLGVVFYEMATGKKPFDGKMMGELFLAIVTEEPPAPRQVRPEISKETEAIIKKMLRKNPAERFESMDELLARLPATPGGKGGSPAALDGSGPPRTTKTRTGVPCPQCRHLNPVGAAFCAQCRHDLREICEQCQCRIPPASRFCSRCGARIERGEQAGVLIGTRGAFSGERIPVDRDFVTVGRHSSNDISFAGGRDDYVSRFHARIFRDKGQFCLEGWDWVKNEATTNGTYVNGRNVDGKGRVPLGHGDRIRFGDSFFRYETSSRFAAE